MDYSDSLAATPAAIDAAGQAVQQFLADEGLHPDDVFRVTVCLAEALNNISEHGYGAAQPGPIRLSCRVAPDVVELSIEDEARDTVAIPEPREEGGMSLRGRGWQILSAWTRIIAVERLASGNLLRLQVARSRPGSAGA